MNVTTKAIATAILSISVWACFSTVAAPPTTASTSDWVLLTQNSDDSQFYSGKRGSYELTTTKNRTSVATILGQTENKNDKTVTYNKWYVSTSDCDAGMGKLVVLKLNGDFAFEAAFVSKGTNIASGIADVVCGIYASDLKKKQGKGI
jgi:hypothetical protein